MLVNAYFVVAGSRLEFDQFRSRDPYAYDKYVYVNDVSSIRGYRNPRGTFVGTWHKLPEIDDIIIQLMVSTDNETTRRQLDFAKKELNKRRNETYI